MHRRTLCENVGSAKIKVPFYTTDIDILRMASMHRIVIHRIDILISWLSWPAILESHIKRKTTNICELSVQGSTYSNLCCEMKRMNLTIVILNFSIH